MSVELKIARGFALPLDLVTEATAIVATRGAGKSSASAVIVEEIFPLGVQTVIFDRTGVYWGLRSNKAGDGPGLPIYVLGGPHGDVPLEPHAGVLIADLVVDHPEHSFVLDLSDFSKSGAIKFAADFLERLYDRKARARTTTLVVMDEAHFYAPQTPRGGFKGDSARLMGAMEDVVGLGRSRGLGVVLTTQRTQALNKAVLDLIETLIVMRMISPRARDAVQDWIREKHEDDREGVIATLESLPTGTAWVWTPLRGILRKVALRRIKTFDSYDTPKPGQARVEPRARKELDLGALGEQMKATAERAKENDPAELRKRIRELEHAVKMAPSGDEATALQSGLRSYRDLVKRIEGELFGGWDDREPDVIVAAIRQAMSSPVEVPVFTEEDREWLKHIGKALDGIPEQMRPIEEKLNELVVKVANHGAVPATTESMDAVRRRLAPPKPPPPPPSPAPPPVRPPHAADARGDVNASEQKVLDAFGWYEALGITTPMKQQVAVVAGYKAIGGRFGNILGGLRTKGLVEYPSGGVAMLTAEGRECARVLDLPYDNAAVQERLMQRLDSSQQKVLREVLRRHPNAAGKQEVAEACGYTAVGGRFGNVLGSLRSLALVEYPSPGRVIARDVLFPVR